MYPLEAYMPDFVSKNDKKSSTIDIGCLFEFVNPRNGKYNTMTERILRVKNTSCPMGGFKFQVLASVS
jgi:hypothetical protein